MKKLFALILVLAMLVSGIAAHAASAGGKGDLVARNAELSAFMDGSGLVYVSGQEKPVNTTRADKVLTIDPYRIIYFAKADAAAGIPAGRLISMNLDGFNETIITDDAYAACLDGDDVYYISSANRNQLMRYSLDSRSSALVFTGAEELQRIYATSNGVIVTLVEGAGAFIQDSITGSFIPYNGTVASESASYEGFDLFLSDNLNLYVQEEDALAATLVDSSVQDWAVIGNTVYYISGSASNLQLKSYNVNNALWSNILQPSADMEMQLTASESALFMLSKAGTVYSVDVRNGKLVGFATLPSLSMYNLGEGKSLSGYRIEAVSGQLNVYGVVNDENTLPTFTFVNYTSQVVEDTSSDVMLLSAYAIHGESTVWDLLQPAAQYSILRKGSRGEAVSAIQQPLYDLGYYSYYIDGIFGWRTERAVKLLQADLGRNVNGIADEELQRIILSGNLDPYDPYKTLKRGSSGWRVQQMQQRLRDLGYLADDADGFFGPRTEKAVALFQEENNLKATGIADSATLRKMYSDSANSCSTYIDLQRGDSGYRVRELNRRLKELYYLEGDVGSSYNSATVAAVTRFQEEIGLKQTGKATTAVQKELFSKYAPEYSGYITLRRGDDNDRVEEMQDRLTDLGYHAGRTDGYFDRITRDSVKKFQHAVGLKATGVADPDTLKELFSSDAPEYKAPVKIGQPVIELSAYSKYENGLFIVSDSVTTDGGITASWYAEGDVANYTVSILDDRDNVYLYNERVDETVASIPITSLDPERCFTVTVTAHPIDEEGDQPTTTSIYFIRVEEEPEPDQDEIGVIGKLIVTPEGENIVREDGVYHIPGEEITFKWSADGDVAGYTYSVTDANGEAVDISAEIASVLGASYTANTFAEGETYTLTVNAIPTNGTMENATTESILFCLKTEASATPEPTTEPVVPDSPDDTPTDPEVTVTPEPEVTEEPEAEATATPEPAVIMDAPVLDIQPNNGIVEQEIINAEGNPEIASVMQVGEGEITLTWATTEAAASYDVLIKDANEVEYVNQPMTGGSGTLPAGSLTPGLMYTMTVTAHAAADPSVTNASTLYFILPVQEEEQVDPIEVEDEQAAPEEIPAEPVQDETVPEEIPAEPVQEEAAPIEIGMPMLAVEPCTGVTEDGLQLVGEGEITLSWYAEGNVAGYNVRIVDGNEAELVNQNMTNNSATIHSDYLEPDMVYTMYVTAYAAEDTAVTSFAELYFAYPAPTEEYVEEPVYEESEEEYAEEPVYEESEEEYAEAPVYEESEEEYVEEPVEEYEEEEPVEEYVEEEPVEEAYYPTDDPFFWDFIVDKNSDPLAIETIQLRLVEWMWLEEDGYKAGKLDKATLQAIVDFQTFCINNGMSVMEIDLDDPMIDPSTLCLLFNSDGIAYMAN